DSVARMTEFYGRAGNVVFDHVLGARVHTVPPEHARAAQDELVALHVKAGRKPYVAPVGGSTPVGALGYVAAFGEIAAQAAVLGISVDAIMHGTSSGGTQAGLIAGAALAHSATRIMGVNVYKKNVADVAGAVHALALETVQMLDGDLDDVTKRLHVI